MEYELYHHGILGMKWGIRRYQNADGSLTPAGRRRLQKNAYEVSKAKREYESAGILKRRKALEAYNEAKDKYDKFASKLEYGKMSDDELLTKGRSFLENPSIVNKSNSDSSNGNNQNSAVVTTRNVMTGKEALEKAADILGTAGRAAVGITQIVNAVSSTKNLVSSFKKPDSGKKESKTNNDKPQQENTKKDKNSSDNNSSSTIIGTAVAKSVASIMSAMGNKVTKTIEVKDPEVLIKAFQAYKKAKNG